MQTLEATVYDWLAGAAAVVGACAVALLVLRVPTRAVLAWAAGAGVGEDDDTVTAVGGALTRMAFVGAAVFVIGAVAGLMLQLKAVALAVALALAVVASASVRVDSGRRRRARLAMDDARPDESRRVLVAGSLLGVGVVSVAAALARLYLERSSERGYVILEWGTVLPDVEYHSLPVVMGSSALLLAAGWVGTVRVRRRRSLAGPDTGADRALRVVSMRRIAMGVLGGQVVLLGAALRAVPLLDPAGSSTAQWLPDPDLMEAAGVLSLTVVVVGLAVLAWAVAVPFWSRALRRQPVDAAHRGR